MNFYDLFNHGGLILIQLGSVLVLFGCTATPGESDHEVTPDARATVQATNTNTPAAETAGEMTTTIESSLQPIPASSISTESPGSERNETITLESLPRDSFNVDWTRAVNEGYISPKGSIDADSEEELVFDLDVVLRFNDPIIKDVLYSHTTHTYWLDCESCHPAIFAPQVAGNIMTMREIQEGKYCGKCHGIVAFPTHVMAGPHFRDNCLKCHNHENR